MKRILSVSPDRPTDVHVKLAIPVRPPTKAAAPDASHLLPATKPTKVLPAKGGFQIQPRERPTVGKGAPTSAAHELGAKQPIPAQVDGFISDDQLHVAADRIGAPAAAPEKPAPAKNPLGLLSLILFVFGGF